MAMHTLYMWEGELYAFKLYIKIILSECVKVMVLRTLYNTYMCYLCTYACTHVCIYTECGVLSYRIARMAHIANNSHVYYILSY